MIDLIKMDLGKIDFPFLQHKLAEKIDRITVSFDRMLAVASIFRKIDGQESSHMSEKVIGRFHGPPPGLIQHNSHWFSP